ncbi:MAG: hypothetical protein NXI23_00540 [Bacteroidetes bacterium]|jgi:hypothetical protein|nr:hypothetical protein [Bacteroidota bacterium]MDF1864014.1 hypothetical protein [Saprospiraceae bacterium]
MSKILLSFTLVFVTSVVFGQVNQKELAQKATQELVTEYQLTTAQSTDMQKIQERKYRNLAEITDLKKSDLVLYIRKMESLEYGTDMSIMRLFKNNKAQLATFNKIRGERRLEKAKFQQEMKNEGLSAEEIETKYWEAQFAKF